MASVSRNTPYGGRELPGRVVATFLRGRATVLDGAPVDQSVAAAAGRPDGHDGEDAA